MEEDDFAVLDLDWDYDLDDDLEPFTEYDNYSYDDFDGLE